MNPPTKFANRSEINFSVRPRLGRREQWFFPFKENISVVYPGGKRRERRSRGNGASPSNAGRDCSRFYDSVWKKRAPASHGSRENRRESPV